MAENLFVYGTLQPEHAPAEIADVVSTLQRLGTGTVRGRLHHFQDYPAVKLDAKNGSRIKGHVYKVPDAAAMKRLDDYEEFDPSAPEYSLFRRTLVRVTVAGGPPMTCWVYEYNRSFPSQRNL